MKNWGDLFNEACDKHASMKEKRVVHNLSGSTMIIKLSKDRDCLFSKARKTKDWTAVEKTTY